MYYEYYFDWIVARRAPVVNGTGVSQHRVKIRNRAQGAWIHALLFWRLGSWYTIMRCMKFSPRVKQKIVTVLRSHPDVRACYVFGSVLGRYLRKESDIDIAVLLPEDMGRSKRFDRRLQLIGVLARALQTDALDVVVLNDVDSVVFRQAILTEGVKIYEASEADCLDFETRTMSLYFDFRPFLDFYNAAYVQRGAR